MKVNFDIYGVQIAVIAEDEAYAPLLARFREDLGYFVRPEPFHDPEIEFVFTAVAEDAAVFAPGLRFFSTRMCRVYGLGRRRVCDYGEGLKIYAWNYRRLRKFRLLDTKAEVALETAYEVAYTTLLSAIGEALDKRGFHRVHALGFERYGEGWLVVLPSGGGKSCLCSLLLRDPSVRIFSDEMPLLRDATIFPFPVRIALKPRDAQALMPDQIGRSFQRRLFPAKQLFPIPPTRVSAPLPVTRLVVRKSGRHSGLRVFSSLWSSLVVGIGLTQMSEHMIRIPSLPRLFLIGCSRLREAGKLSREAKKFQVPEREFRWFQNLNNQLTELIVNRS